MLVNNAAVLHLAALEDTRAADFERLVRVNQLGTFLGIRSVVAPMRAAGRGSIVNVSSVDGLAGKNGVAAYASTKWAVRGLTRVAAIELGRYGIRVNAVCPEAGSARHAAALPPGRASTSRRSSPASSRSSRRRRAGRSPSASATWRR